VQADLQQEAEREKGAEMDQESPQQRMGQMLIGYCISQALYVVAKLGLADLLRDRPRTADDLALATQTHRSALYRLLRALASVGVFAEDDRRYFSLTPLADCLRSDVPGSQCPRAIASGELFYPAWGQLLFSVQTGGTAFEKVYGLPVFDYLSRHPRQARLFDGAMASIHGRETVAMLEAYDFSSIRVLADIGGGNGSVLTAVLQKHSDVRGILFDLPEVAERGGAIVEAAGLTERCPVVGGDFFASIPAGADACLLRHIIHDWNDDEAVTILRNVHRGLGRGGRLLVVEHVLPPGNEPSIGKLLDLAMLLVPGGQERTAEEYHRLLTAAGFRLTRIVPTNAEVSVIEGRKE
jgi:hypothetical protein